MQSISISRLKQPTPRYTSYPTAPHFQKSIDAQSYKNWLAGLPPKSTVSLYLHIPFCDRLCWFCGCTTKQTNRYDPIKRYLRSVHLEIAAVAAQLPKTVSVTALHLGGGSPTMLEPDDLTALMATFRRHFSFADGAEISVEMDPNDLNDAKYDALADFGVTRASLGVQDFDPKVQQAINRPQTFEQTRQVVEAMRARGVGSVNLDMLYGLPHQNLDTIDDTVDKIVSLDPDRIALFGYAHVPWVKKHQNMIDVANLPGIQARYEQAEHAAARFIKSGFRRIGMDHFARQHDTMSIAEQDGTLRRNFQGYTSDHADVLIGIGASSIGRLPQGYVQNTPSTHEYQRRIEGDEKFATVRGIHLSDDDRMRAWLIERLMCDFGFSAADLSRRFGQVADAALSEAAVLAANDTEHHFVQSGEQFLVTESGRPYLRLIASQFDRYLKQGETRHSVSV